MISDRWGSHFASYSKGNLSEDELGKLKNAVQRAHAAGRKLRLWATPEDERLWELLVSLDVDLFNTDELKRLSRFLKTRISP